MKMTGFLLVNLMALFFYSDVATAELPMDCSGYPKPMCTLEYIPHCGSTHKTYANKCDFCNAFVESGRKLELAYYGECRKDVAVAELPIDCSGYPRPMCTKEYTPHCGYVHKTYSNKCAFCNAFVESNGKLELEYYGECKKDAKE